MTHQEKSAFGSLVRKCHGYCSDIPAAISAFMAEHPHIPAFEIRSLASMAHGVPFPSIRGRKEGPFPVYPDRPYLDARFWLDQGYTMEDLDKWW